MTSLAVRPVILPGNKVRVTLYDMTDPDNPVYHARVYASAGVAFPDPIA